MHEATRRGAGAVGERVELGVGAKDERADCVVAEAGTRREVEVLYGVGAPQGSHDGRLVEAL